MRARASAPTGGATICMRRSVALQRRAIGCTDERICALTGLGRVYAETAEPGLVEAASILAGEARALAAELTQAYHIAAALSGQARLLAALSRPQEAAGFARRALEAAESEDGEVRS